MRPAINGSETTLSATEGARHLRLSHMPVDLGMGASHNAPNYPIETPQLSHLHCALRVDPTETVGQQASVGRAQVRPLVSGR